MLTRCTQSYEANCNFWRTVRDVIGAEGGGGKVFGEVGGAVGAGFLGLCEAGVVTSLSQRKLRSFNVLGCRV